MFEAAGEQMRSGDYLGAIRTYEGHLERLSDVPVEQLSGYFGDLGLAHLYQGEQLVTEGRKDEAKEHFQRAAFMFEQAAHTATYRVIASVANFYRVLALFASEEYAEVNAVGEQYLAEQPEAAVTAELLPEGIVASVKEILAVSYHALADVSDPEDASELRAKGLRYAEEAIAEAPQRVIQPYYFTGIDAYERGSLDLARERLQTFIRLMERVPESDWDAEDVESVEMARRLLGRF